MSVLASTGKHRLSYDTTTSHTNYIVENKNSIKNIKLHRRTVPAADSIDLTDILRLTDALNIEQQNIRQLRISLITANNNKKQIQEKLNQLIHNSNSIIKLFSTLND